MEDKNPEKIDVNIIPDDSKEQIVTEITVKTKCEVKGCNNPQNNEIGGKLLCDHHWSEIMAFLIKMVDREKITKIEVDEEEYKRLKELEKTVLRFVSLSHSKARSQFASWRSTLRMLLNQESYSEIMKALKDCKDGKTVLLSHTEIFKLK